MKILMVAPHYYPYLGGLENYARHIAAGLVERGHEVVVVTSNQAGRREEIGELDGVQIYRLPYWFKFFNTPINPLWRRYIRRIIKDIKPDIINAHTPVPYLADISERVRGNVPYVLTYHNDLTKDGWLLNSLCRLEYMALTNKTLRQSTCIIGTSQSYIEHSPYLSAYSQKCHVVSPGVDTKLFTRSVNKHNRATIIFVGQLHRNHAHKGLDVLLSAMAYLHTKNVELIVVGEGDKLADYKKQAAVLNLTHVTFMGRVDDQKLASAYQRASVLVLPSTSVAEGFGMVILEAAASGTPSVASNIGGISEAIQEGKTGLLVQPGDPHALATALDELLSDHQLLTLFGNQAFERATRDFNWSEQARKTEVIFKAIVGEAK